MRRTLLLLLSFLTCVAWGQSYRYRYWIDNNVGSAVSGSATGEKELTISLSSVGYGLHAIHVQGRNSAGVWSSVRTRYFLKEKSDQTCTSARYWIDNDMTTLHDNVATSGAIELDIAGLKNGLHAVHYQKIGTDGTTSAVRTRYFLKEEENQTCTSARYWIDNDMTTLHDNVATSGIIDIDITKLDVGLHAVHYQKIGTDGTPSAVRTRYFLVDRVQPGNFTATLSIDDGETTDYVLTGEDIVLEIGELEKGEHTLHVTLTDDKGNNYGTQEHVFTVYKAEAQTLDLETLPQMTYGDEAYELPEETTEGMALTWTSSDEAVATVNGSLLSIVGAGVATITAMQEGDEMHLPFTREYSLTIGKATLTITANDCTKLEGEDNPELEVSYSGFKYGDDASSLTTQPIVTTTATVDSPAGTYPITVSGAASNNYAFTYVNGTLTVIDAATLNNRLYASDLTSRPGEEQTVALQLDNEKTFIACEFNLQLPAGFSIKEDEDGYLMADIVSSRSNRHTFEARDDGNGKYHFLCYSNSNKAFKGNSGDFIILSIVADETVAEGVYVAELQNVIFSDENKVQVNLANSSFNINVVNYTLGDVNGDGKLNVMDIVEMVGNIMGDDSDTFVFVAADIDGNGTVNVMDLVNLVEIIMNTASQAPTMTAFDPSCTQAAFGNMELVKDDGYAVTISVPDADKHIAAQFIVTLSDGGALLGVASDRAHQSQFIRMDDGRYLVMVYSNSNASFKNDRAIRLQMSGNYNVKVEDLVFVDTTEEAVAYETAMLSTTGVMTVGSAFDSPSDIFSVDGTLVKKDATSMLGLAKGVYVVNGKKVIVK